jgi:endonuclease YncB( thermonuclease family)
MSHYRYRKLHGWSAVFITILIALLSLAQNQGWLSQTSQKVTENQPGLYSVSRFVDGDTITVNMNGKTEKVRLVGVDTPETHKPNTPVQCYGSAAAAFTKNSLTGKKFRLVSDSLSTDRDRYDRLLRYVVLTNGANFNQKLIEQGYGFYYPYFPFTKSDEFATAQESAKSANRGLWGNCKPTPTDKGGWVSNDAN